MSDNESGQSLLGGQNNITTSPGQSMTSGQTSGQSLSGQIAFPNRTTYLNRSSMMINQICRFLYDTVIVISIFDPLLLERKRKDSTKGCRLKKKILIFPPLEDHELN